jgi:tRNA (cmo5U34)-methyltransferase
MKSTVDEIRARFDGDVERFSNLATGQTATIDAPLVLDLICQAALAVTPGARHILDVGCGAGNYSLKLLSVLPDCDVTLIDLSRPMLDRAVQRISPATRGAVRAIQGDIRDIELSSQSIDVIVAAAVLHHLRHRDQWESVYRKLYAALRPGGSLWVADLIEHELPPVQAMMWRRYGEYLAQLQGDAYRESVLAYVQKEDTPIPLTEQLAYMRQAGFSPVDVLHKNSVFAAFGGVRAATSFRSPSSQE